MERKKSEGIEALCTIIRLCLFILEKEFRPDKLRGAVSEIIINNSEATYHVTIHVN